VRFKTLASFGAGVFFRAADFSSRTSEAVHERRFDFLAIKESPVVKKRAFLADSNDEENRNFGLRMHRRIFGSGGVGSKQYKEKPQLPGQVS
jgi:hypothetical protein